MSHVAIAAALALEDISAGERLVAFSLASFANREHRAWPGTRVAAVRAGLSRSQYLAARDGLRRRELVAVEEEGGGRGNSPVVMLLFARSGPWLEGEINAPLFEATLGYSRVRGSGRLLLATLAALADEHFEVSGLSTNEIRAAAGMADSTYRRARTVLLASGELVLDTAGGGRARTNQWLLRNPRETGGQPPMAHRTRPVPSANARPLIATVTQPPAVQPGGGAEADAEGDVVNGPGLTGVSELNPGQIRTVSAVKGPGLSGVFELNPAQSRTVSQETPPHTPPQTPPPNARAGREPQNPRTSSPPSPPNGGSLASSVSIVEEYVTDRGRKRKRTIVVELDDVREQLRQPTEVDLDDWQRIQSKLRRTVSESMFELWLAQLHPAAADRDGTLLIASPPDIRSWVADRYGRLLEQTGQSAGRNLRFASERELQLIQGLAAAQLPPRLTNQSKTHKEAV